MLPCFRDASVLTSVAYGMAYGEPVHPRIFDNLFGRTAFEHAHHI